MKYFIKTFGCQANEADSERMAAGYEFRGWQKAEAIDGADEIIINTCSVRESAEHRVLGLVNNLIKKKKKKQKIILTGCMLYHPLKWLKEKLPGVDEFKPIKEFKASPNLKSKNSNFKLVPIMEGCNNFCTYCVVPYSRGREKSRPFEEIVCEVKELVKRGHKEIMLLGQNVNAYGQDLQDTKVTFANLLRTLNDLSDLEKISFMTSNPWDLKDEIIEALKLPKIDRYLHLPVQSGDDEILRRMNRHYKASDYLNLVKKIKKQIPKIQIGTDIIVGFPGESKKQFLNTFKLCKKVGFVKAYIAMYSPRPQTAAFKFKDDILHEEKKRRFRILDKLINA